MAPPRRLDHDAIASDDVNRLDLTVEEIAAAHGCNRNTVRRIARRRGIPQTRKLPKYDHQAIADMYATGDYTMVEVARQFGCDPTTVRDVAQARGLAERC